MKSVEEINAEYRAKGWGKVAEHFGHQPYYVDDKVVGAYEEIYEALNDASKLHALRTAVIGKRIRQVMIAGQLFGPEEVHDIRAALIKLRDGALETGAMEWAIILSQVIGLMLCLECVFDGDEITRNGQLAYLEVSGND